MRGELAAAYRKHVAKYTEIGCYRGCRQVQDDGSCFVFFNVRHNGTDSAHLLHGAGLLRSCASMKLQSASLTHQQTAQQHDQGRA